MGSGCGDRFDRLVAESVSRSTTWAQSKSMSGSPRVRSAVIRVGEELVVMGATGSISCWIRWRERWEGRRRFGWRASGQFHARGGQEGGRRQFQAATLRGINGERGNTRAGALISSPPTASAVMGQPHLLMAAISSTMYICSQNVFTGNKEIPYFE
jgi:hypothetical protein